jgi:Protein of unknown function (DUF1559)
VLILPYMEQENLFKQWDLRQRYYQQVGAPNSSILEVNVPSYFCPSRRSASSSNFSMQGDERTIAPKFPPTPGGLSDYAACQGNGIGVASGGANGALIIANYTLSPPMLTDPQAIVASWRSRTTLSSIVDGTSNTIFVGEKHVRPDKFYQGPEDSSVFNGDNTYPFSRVAGQHDASILPLASSPTDSFVPSFRFGSYHPGVCQFVMGDGSVRAIPTSINIDTLTRLAVRNDGLPVGDF